MNEGFVLWFNKIKGYGFIENKNNKEHLFVYYRDIKDFKFLEKNDEVFFEIINGEKGKKAINVRKK